MSDTDFREWAEKAAAEAPDPRALKCRWPWSHEWTLWNLAHLRYVEIFPARAVQLRRCTRCGWMQGKWLKGPRR